MVLRNKWYIAEKPELDITTDRHDFRVCTQPSEVGWMFDTRVEADGARAGLLHGNLVRISASDGEQIECTLKVEEDRGRFVIACIPLAL
jgi:hypothetical protein